MFYLLYELTKDSPGFFRLFGSPIFRTIAALSTALFICLLLYPWLIRKLQVKQIGQVVRHDGPETHLSKRGTPTMGGVLLILAMLVSCLFWCNLENPFVWLTLGITLAYAVIGFLDDYWKIRDRSSGGMPEKLKLVTQLVSVGVLVVVFFGYVAPTVSYDLKLYFPFVKPDLFAIELPA